MLSVLDVFSDNQPLPMVERKALDHCWHRGGSEAPAEFAFGEFVCICEVAVGGHGLTWERLDERVQMSTYAFEIGLLRQQLCAYRKNDVLLGVSIRAPDELFDQQQYVLSRMARFEHCAGVLQGQ